MGLTACHEREKPGAAPVDTSAPHAASTTPSASGQTFELDGLKVTAQFAGYRLLREQSDPSAGLVAFAPEHPSADRSASLFLDGSRTTSLPKTPAEALASILADDACKEPGACTELSHAALPNQGWLVSVRKPHAVYTELWRKNAQERVVRCGAELSELGAEGAAKRWLDDAAAVRAAQTANELLCRGVVPLP